MKITHTPPHLQELQAKGLGVFNLIRSFCREQIDYRIGGIDINKRTDFEEKIFIQYMKGNVKFPQTTIPTRAYMAEAIGDLLYSGEITILDINNIIGDHPYKIIRDTVSPKSVEKLLKLFKKMHKAYDIQWGIDKTDDLLNIRLDMLYRNFMLYTISNFYDIIIDEEKFKKLKEVNKELSQMNTKGYKEALGKASNKIETSDIAWKKQIEIKGIFRENGLWE